MISHNKYPQNLISLYALENQTFDLKKMEVILVDDASTDETPILNNYNPTFEFKYIRCELNVGRSKAKNIGIAAAKGKILILIDTEMILDPEFVEQHYKLHQSNKNLCVTGCYSHYNTFTVLDKNFNEKQFRKLTRVVRRNKYHTINIGKIFKKKSKVELFSKKDIQQQKYKKLAFHRPFFRQIIEHFGYEYKGFYMPYIFVITHNISLRKSTFDSVGPFYEGFQGWGCEDWEFGYRLYKHGVKILDNPHVNVYHQEHPRSLNNQDKDSLINYKIFYNRHNKFDVGVQALCWIGLDLFKANDLIIEYISMVKRYPDKFTYVEQAFRKIFRTIFTQKIEEKPVTKLLHNSGMLKDKEWVKRFYKNLNELRSTGKFPKLLSTMEWLLKM